jgi:hypothetical protein
MNKLLLLSVLTILSACPSQPEPILEPQIVEISFNQITNSSLKASSRTLRRGLQTQTLTPRTDFTKTAVSESTFTYNGFRYIQATFDFDDTGSSPTNYSFIALSNASSILGTAVSSLKLYDGTNAPLALARDLRPIHGSEFNGVEVRVVPEIASFQAWRGTDLPSSPAFSSLLDYGFVARQSQYYVTFAYKIPLQANRKDDPYSLTFQFAVYNDSVNTVTESLEEQGTSSGIGSRASNVSATLVNVFPNSSFSSSAVKTLCRVRIAERAVVPYNQNIFLYPVQSTTTGCVQ